MSDVMRDEFEVLFAAETAKKAAPGQADEFESIGGFASVLVEAMRADRIGDTYHENLFAAAWWAWQASRECLVIELPKARTNVGAAYIAACKTSIHAAGVRTK